MVYSRVMVTGMNPFKCTVAALSLLVGFSIPGAVVADRLDDLFEELKTAEEFEVDRIQSQIFTEWRKSGSAAVDLLARRGQEAMAEGDLEAAVEHFSAAIDHAPEFAEAYNGRATAYYLMEEIGPSIADIQSTLALEPRHFGAMSGFAMILEEIGREEAALEVYSEIRGLAPAWANVQEAIQRLELKVQGRDL